MVPVPERYELFDQIRELAGSRLAEAVGKLLPRIADELTRHPGGAVSLQSEIALAEAALILREEIDVRRESAASALSEFHFRSLQDPQRSPAPGDHGNLAPAPGAPAAAFALVSDMELADQILARTLSARAREALEEAYPAYLSRLAQLTGAEPDEDNCPIGATALATALVAAVRPYSAKPSTRDRLQAALLKHAVIPVREIIAAADRKMVEQGILSTLPRIVVFPGLRKAVEGAVTRSARGTASVQVKAPAAPPPADVPGSDAATPPAVDAAPALETPSVPANEQGPAPQPAASASEQSSRDAFAGTMAGTARKIVRDVRASMVLGSHPMVGTRDPRSAFRHAELLPGIDSLERDAIAFAHQVGHQPFSAAARQEFFSQLRQQMKTAGVDAAHLATLDLVAVMFDYAADHERIPDPVRPLMWRMQLPSVTLACLDPGYLSDEPRSVRRLVEHVAAIATAYPDDIDRGSELYGRLQTVVRAVEVVAHAFQVRSQVLSEQVKIEYQRAIYGMGQLVSKVTRERSDLDANAGRRNRRDYRNRPSREREFEISGRIEKLLAERLRDREVPESVAEFLKGVWLRHLRTAVLRDGEESAGYQAALKVVDDLLWTIDGEGRRRSRSELAQRIPLMLRILTQGINDIGARPEDYRPFFDEMFLIHLRRMQRRSKSGKSAAPGIAEGLPVLSEQVPGTLPSPAPSPAPAAIDRAASPVPDPGRLPTAPFTPAAPAAPAEETDEEPPLLVLPTAGSDLPESPAAASSLPDAAEAGSDATAPSAPRRPRPHSRTATRPGQGNDAQSASELKLRRLIDNTSLDDAPHRPVRMEIAPAELARDLAPGQWLELITSTRKKILAKVAWINDRRSVVLLLQHPDRLILSRHVTALQERAERKRVFRVE